MPSIQPSFLKSIIEDITNYPCFIETGTLCGDTIFSVENIFSKLYTIELSEHHYNSTKSKYSGNKITFIHGDSSNVFKHLLPTISDKCIFFLDGHYSSGNTAQGNKDCPLIEELAEINDKFRQKAIIIIDDARLFGHSRDAMCGEDWSSINETNLLSVISSRIEKYYYLDSDIAKNDRLIIHINSL